MTPQRLAMLTGLIRKLAVRLGYYHDEPEDRPPRSVFGTGFPSVSQGPRALLLGLRVASVGRALSELSSCSVIPGR